MAQLQNMRGNKQQAIENLQRASALGGLSCAYCLRSLHHYANLQGDPAFEALVDDTEAYLVAQREKLAGEGLLLTPDEVMQLDEFIFDPFAN